MKHKYNTRADIWSHGGWWLLFLNIRCLLRISYFCSLYKRTLTLTVLQIVFHNKCKQLTKVSNRVHFVHLDSGRSNLENKDQYSNWTGIYRSAQLKHSKHFLNHPIYPCLSTFQHTQTPEILTLGFKCQSIENRTTSGWADGSTQKRYLITPGPAHSDSVSVQVYKFITEAGSQSHGDHLCEKGMTVSDPPTGLKCIFHHVTILWFQPFPSFLWSVLLVINDWDNLLSGILLPGLLSRHQVKRWTAWHSCTSVNWPLPPVPVSLSHTVSSVSHSPSPLLPSLSSQLPSSSVQRAESAPHSWPFAERKKKY